MLFQTHPFMVLWSHDAPKGGKASSSPSVVASRAVKKSKASPKSSPKQAINGNWDHWMPAHHLLLVAFMSLGLVFQIAGNWYAYVLFSLVACLGLAGCVALARNFRQWKRKLSEPVHQGYVGALATFVSLFTFLGAYFQRMSWAKISWWVSLAAGALALVVMVQTMFKPFRPQRVTPAWMSFPMYLMWEAIVSSLMNWTILSSIFILFGLLLSVAVQFFALRNFALAEKRGLVSFRDLLQADYGLLFTPIPLTSLYILVAIQPAKAIWGHLMFLACLGTLAYSVFSFRYEWKKQPKRPGYLGQGVLPSLMPLVLTLSIPWWRGLGDINFFWIKIVQPIALIYAVFVVFVTLGAYLEFCFTGRVSFTEEALFDLGTSAANIALPSISDLGAMKDHLQASLAQQKEKILKGPGAGTDDAESHRVYTDEELGIGAVSFKKPSPTRISSGNPSWNDMAGSNPWNPAEAAGSASGNARPLATGKQSQAPSRGTSQGSKLAGEGIPPIAQGPHAAGPTHPGHDDDLLS